jgi:TFIIF, beta subunit HTH domain/TFIIF, beta subunit N-terminus
MGADDDDDVEEEEKEEPELLTAESYGSLDTTNITDQCWLIRVPNKLYEQWKDLPEGTDLGELVFGKGGPTNNNSNNKANVTAAAVKPSLMIHVKESSIAANTNLPLKYSLAAMTKKIPGMHPFVRNPNTGACTIFGTITRTANLQVAAAQADTKYRAMLKDRLVATTIRDKGFVKMMDNPVAATAAAAPNNVNKSRSFGHAVLDFGKRKLEAQDSAGNGPSKVASMMNGGDSSASSSAKKSRHFAPGESVRSVLFALFGVERYWTAKDLKNAAMSGGFDMTKKAETEMRDLLRNELAIYHRTGDHKNQWELKEEFRQDGSGDNNAKNEATI